MEKIQGDKFKQFIEDNRKPVCRIIMKSFNVSGDDAEDIYQNSAIALYKSIKTGLPTTMERYFKGIWRNQSLKFLKKHKREVHYDMSASTSDTSKVPDISFRNVDEILKKIPTSPDEAFDHNQMKERVSKALDEMAEKCRQLLMKYYIEGYSWAELAVQYELRNADSAKVVASKCRKRFREKYKELEIYVK